MKKKYFLVISFLILAMFLVGCSGTGMIPSTSVLSANIIITEWKQDYYDWSWGGEWSDYVYVYYEVENTGNVEIDYYKVYLTVTCADGSKYYDWTNGLSVGVGHKYSDWTMVNVAGKQAISVMITDWELTHYTW
ncbi:MAG: hypothetical protein FP833_12445 [Atribacteria sp.]|nr:hypothetical protein [Candidatus Atribacteria bacterium]MBU4293918.1 hypothetical protein [Actinomycetota bacterium]MBU4450658.1 hypothetical protein [Actinomycetota bacterium]